MKTFKTTLPLLLAVFVFSCKKQTVNDVTSTAPATVAPAVTLTAATLTTTVENFETGTKAAYAAADVTLTTGVWNLNDALIGNTTSDRKNGSQSARVRNSGKLTMKFNLSNGASTVTILHAKYGSDASSTWQLWYSTNNGSTYTQTGGTITTSSTTLQTASFTVNVSGTIRFEIRKTDGSANRINFDDISFTDYGSGSGGGGGTGKKFLFDATKAETAGNADWVIDEDSSPQQFPTPAQSTITSSTAETYWTGAISSWGIALVKAGQSVETLPSTGTITYGNTSNAQDLSKYDVFVVDEPNIRFTTAEKTAILNFVNNGGGLFMISDHTVSDRNNDGWDSPAIWNDLMNNNGTVTNPFGFTVDLTNITETTSNVLSGNSTNPILHGSQGNVTQLDFHNGATLTLNPAANSTVQGLIWQTGAAQGNTKVMSAAAGYGLGRVYMVTDSSPMDDGTGAPGNTLFNGWTTFSHIPLFMNASLWLAKLQ
ncbi:MAG: hydrolase [Bacteroidetes bacterium]|nr:hydrolase [Bacteroidota bacterium]